MSNFLRVVSYPFSELIKMMKDAVFLLSLMR